MARTTADKKSIKNSWRQGMLLRPMDALLIGIFLIIMLALGTFVDYPLSESLYDPSSRFGLILASYGQLPSSAGAVLAGTLFLIGRDREKRSVRLLQCGIGLVMIGVGVYMLCENPVEYMEMNLVLSCIIALGITALMVALAFFVSRNARREDILMVATVFLLTILIQMVIINLIKDPWGRPRMRLVEVNSEVSFVPWYQPGTSLRDRLVAMGVEAEEFRSFPSGHTGHAVILMLYGLLPWLRAGGSEAERHGILDSKDVASGVRPMSSIFSVRLFIWIGFAWAVLVAFSRMIMGAHFLTDTTVGFAISFLCVLIIPAWVFRRRK